MTADSEQRNTGKEKLKRNKKHPYKMGGKFRELENNRKNNSPEHKEN